MKKELLALCNKLLDDDKLEAAEKAIVRKFAFELIREAVSFGSMTHSTIGMALNI